MVKGRVENSTNPSGLRFDISLGRVCQHWGIELASTQLASVGESSRKFFGVWGKPHNLVSERLYWAMEEIRDILVFVLCLHSSQHTALTVTYSLPHTRFPLFTILVSIPGLIRWHLLISRIGVCSALLGGGRAFRVVPKHLDFIHLANKEQLTIFSLRPAYYYVEVITFEVE